MVDVAAHHGELFGGPVQGLAHAAAAVGRERATVAARPRTNRVRYGATRQAGRAGVPVRSRRRAIGRMPRGRTASLRVRVSAKRHSSGRAVSKSVGPWATRAPSARALAAPSRLRHAVASCAPRRPGRAHAWPRRSTVKYSRAATEVATSERSMLTTLSKRVRPSRSREVGELATPTATRYRAEPVGAARAARLLRRDDLRAAGWVMRPSGDSSRAQRSLAWPTRDAVGWRGMAPSLPVPPRRGESSRPLQRGDRTASDLRLRPMAIALTRSWVWPFDAAWPAQ